jgi:hypothetical protein
LSTHLAIPPVEYIRILPVACVILATLRCPSVLQNGTAVAFYLLHLAVESSTTFEAWVQVFVVTEETGDVEDAIAPQW